MGGGRLAVLSQDPTSSGWAQFHPAGEVDAQPTAPPPTYHRQVAFLNPIPSPVSDFSPTMLEWPRFLELLAGYSHSRCRAELGAWPDGRRLTASF